jgi:hypothetical protein
MERHHAEGMDRGDSWQIPLEDRQFEQFSAAGFTIGSRKDSVLVNVVAPVGWTIRAAGSDPRHREFIDANGIKRGRVFLKVTSYDYYGHSSLVDE